MSSGEAPAAGIRFQDQETEDSHIELIQRFDDVHSLDSTYHIFAPIKKLPIEFR